MQTKLLKQGLVLTAVLVAIGILASLAARQSFAGSSTLTGGGSSN